MPKLTPHDMMWYRKEKDADELKVKVRVYKSIVSEKIEIVFNKPWWGVPVTWEGTLVSEDKKGKHFSLKCETISGSGKCVKYHKKKDGIEGNWFWFSNGVKLNENWEILEP